MGDTGRAAAHFEDALTFGRRAGYRPELAWTSCDFADLLLVRAHSPSTSSATVLKVKSSEQQGSKDDKA